MSQVAAQTVGRTTLKRIGITCVCFNMRKASRMITRHYDEVLEPTGLRSTQFTILASIGRHQNMSISRLAHLLVMDRTTLTRNLRPLEKMKLVAYREAEDRRRRELELTGEGWSKLEEAVPFWERAQVGLTCDLGDDNSRSLLKNLWRYIHGKRYLGA